MPAVFLHGIMQWYVKYYRYDTNRSPKNLIIIRITDKGH